MIQALHANEYTLPTNLDAKKYDRVGLIMKDTLYTALEKGTPWEYPDNTGTSLTITANFTAINFQQSNETYGKARQIFENSATIDE